MQWIGCVHHNSIGMYQHVIMLRDAVFMESKDITKPEKEFNLRLETTKEEEENKPLDNKPEANYMSEDDNDKDGFERNSEDECEDKPNLIP